MGQSIKTRSRTLQTALASCNLAGSKLNPPKPKIEPSRLMEAAFISDFEMLGDLSGDIRTKPWASPAGRVALDQYYRILQAREELVRLNIEIRRLVTYMADEKDYVTKVCDGLIADGKSSLAYHVNAHYLRRARSNKNHMDNLNKLATNPSFSGSLAVGDSAFPSIPLPQPPPVTASTSPQTADVNAAESVERSSGRVVNIVPPMMTSDLSALSDLSSRSYEPPRNDPCSHSITSERLLRRS
jgi:hypothetical protein